jgi:hypothetical protein
MRNLKLRGFLIRFRLYVVKLRKFWVSIHLDVKILQFNLQYIPLWKFSEEIFAKYLINVYSDFINNYEVLIICRLPYKKHRNLQRQETISPPFPPAIELATNQVILLT